MAIVEKQTIRFTPDRRLQGRSVNLGNEGDNLVRRLMFALPDVDEHQAATLMYGGKYADMIRLTAMDGKWAADLTSEMVGAAGEVEGYIRIDGPDGEVWRSDPFRIETGDVPEIEVQIEKLYPTAIGQMLTAMEQHSSEMRESEELLDQLNKEAQAAADTARTAAAAADGASRAAAQHRNAAQAAAEGASASEADAEAAAESARRMAAAAQAQAQEAALSADGAASEAVQAAAQADRATAQANQAQAQAQAAGQSANVAGSEANRARDEADRAYRAAEGFETPTAQAQLLEAGMQPTAAWERDGDGLPVLKLGIPKGDQGERGIQGERGPQGIQGVQGVQGKTGPQGERGAAFTYSDFTAAQLEALRGPEGKQGPKGDKGDTGDVGPEGREGPAGKDGKDGTPGRDGADGRDGAPGADGKSAYQYAVDGGYKGTEAEFAEKLAQEIPEAYTLPTASETVKGGVMVGDDFAMDGETLKVKPENIYELIETIFVGHTLLAEQPEDWESNFGAYYKIKSGALSALTKWEEFIPYSFYAADGTEAMDALNRTEEPDGTPYKFKRMLIKIDIAASSTPGTYNWLFNTTGASVSISNMVHTARRLSWCDAKLENGYVRAISGVSGSEYSSPNTVQNAYYYLNNTRYGDIYSVKCSRSGDSSGRIPAGTKIEVWAVRS